MFLKFWLVLVLCVMSSAALAEREVVRCAVYDTPPWVLPAEQGYAGVAPYYAEKFSRVAGMDIELLPMPYQRSLNSIRSQEVDFVIALPNLELREHAEPFVKIGKLAIVLFSALPMDELYAKPVSEVSLAIVEGTDGLTAGWVPEWPATRVSGELRALRAAAKRRFDAVLVTRNTYEYWAEREPEIAAGHVKDVGLSQVYAWINKRRTDKAHYAEARAEIEKTSFGGKIVLDWYTVSLPPVD